MAENHRNTSSNHTRAASCPFRRELIALQFEEWDAVEAAVKLAGLELPNFLADAVLQYAEQWIADPGRMRREHDPWRIPTPAEIEARLQFLAKYADGLEALGRVASTSRGRC